MVFVGGLYAFRIARWYELAAAYAYARTVRLADGPDQVHMIQLGRNLIAETAAKMVK